MASSLPNLAVALRIAQDPRSISLFRNSGRHLPENTPTSLTAAYRCAILWPTWSLIFKERNVSWMDVFLLLVLMGGLAVGYVQGLWRQAMSLAAILAGLILATYLQVFLTAWLGFISPDTPLVIRGTAAFLALLAIIAGVLDFVGRRIFPETKLAVLGIFDRLGGIMLGFFTICIQVGAGVLIFKFLARVRWPMGESVRLVLNRGIDSSTLLPIFHQLLVTLVSVVGPLLPEGAPSFLKVI